MSTETVTDCHVLTLAELDRETWASCGPASLAALLRRPLAEIRHAFPSHTAEKTWTNLAMMDRALARLGVKREHTLDDIAAQLFAHGAERPKAWPRRGLVIIQFRGSWDAMPVNHPAQLQRTHWIAISPMQNPDGAATLVFGRELSFAFDVNMLVDRTVPTSCGWTTRETWERRFAPDLARAAHGKRATGAWWVRAGIEVADDR